VNLGIALPVAGLPLGAHRALIEELPDLGYTDVWTAEGGGTDAITPLAAAAAWSPSLRLGTGIVPVSTRGPAVLAQTAATLAELAPGRVTLGIGSSVPDHVTAINGIPFDRPYARVRDMLRFLRTVLHGGFAGPTETLPVSGFRLRRVPPVPPRVILGALRPGMVNLGLREGDGVITNILYPEDIRKVVRAIDAPLAGKEFAVKVFVCPTADSHYARDSGRAFLGWIINQPPYRAFHQWLGREDLLKAVSERWDAGDAGGAAAAVPEEVVDALWIHGSPDQCREQIERYLQPEVTTLVVYLAPTPEIRERPETLRPVLGALAGQPARRA